MLTIDSINPAVLATEYAVRGAIAIRAEELRTQLQDPKKATELGFDCIINANIGNPQQLGQKPITFWRQVIAMIEYPELIETSSLPNDAKARARILLDAIGSSGAYTHSQGIPLVRQHVAEFIEARDGHSANASDIFLTAGASAGVSQVIQLCSGHERDAILIPRPQYPLYSASLAQNQCHALYYDMDEGEEWTINIEVLSKTIDEAKRDGYVIRAIAVINPGNPTGSCLPIKTMDDILNLCHWHNLVLMADEVYQDNIFDTGRRFISFKKALLESAVHESVQLFSFHSISKGLAGECGKRGGYFEAVNVPEQIMQQIYKMASVNLCAPVVGQIGVDLLVKPPQDGDESYTLWQQETQDIRAKLASRNQILWERLNQLEGIQCAKAPGALYLFPSITLPSKACDEAKAHCKAPDTFYCLQLLEQTGIVVVPGNGFGQKEGSLHFRTTILAPGAEVYIDKIAEFHKSFLKKYS